MSVFKLRSVILFFFAVYFGCLDAQPAYQFNVQTNKYLCEKATATLQISGTHPLDTVHIAWSTGQTETLLVYGLENGEYSVNIKIKHQQDSVTSVHTDTLIHFSVEKELCGISVDKYFSPNDDNYHDKLSISNIQYHPNFELNIFNKWGQRVHVQHKEYEPWDGKWNGIDLPDGTYYYVFFYDSANKSQVSKGDITILR